MNRFILSACVCALLCASGVPAAAEEGDYSGWQKLLNLMSPPPADDPVRPEERQGDFPLLSNPSGFEDGFAPSAYLKWQTVQLGVETGAICGNGTPYKFFVNRVAHTRNTLIYFEGGGACWDFASCTGQAGIRGARNPDGIPDDYLDKSNPAASLVSPFVFRLHPYSRVKTQSWNLVYVPYCTGDVYSGDKISLYEDPTGAQEPIVWRHNGVRNTRAVISWLRDNLPAPTQAVVTGCSAGGAGALTNYHHIRRDLHAKRGFLLDDSGPVYPTDANGPDGENPSVYLHEAIKTAWGLADLFEYLSRDLLDLDFSDLGSINEALAYAYPLDRMGHTHFQRDQNYSSYSYERFYPEIRDETNDAIKAAKLTEKWLVDTGKLMAQLNGLSNFGYYFPFFRDVNESHCTTIIDFDNSDIQEAGLELSDFINNVLLTDSPGPVLEAFEEDQESDLQKPVNRFYRLIEWLL